MALAIDVIEDAIAATINALNPAYKANPQAGKDNDALDIAALIQRNGLLVFVQHESTAKADVDTYGGELAFTFSVNIIVTSLRGTSKASRGNLGAYAVLDAIRTGLDESTLGLVVNAEPITGVEWLSEDVIPSDPEYVWYEMKIKVTVPK